VRRPEIVIARSAHAAYYKAAEYFKMRLITLPVGADLRLSGGLPPHALCVAAPPLLCAHLVPLRMGADLRLSGGLPPHALCVAALPLLCAHLVPLRMGADLWLSGGLPPHALRSARPCGSQVRELAARTPRGTCVHAVNLARV